MSESETHFASPLRFTITINMARKQPFDKCFTQQLQNSPPCKIVFEQRGYDVCVLALLPSRTAAAHHTLLLRFERYYIIIAGETISIIFPLLSREVC